MERKIILPMDKKDWYFADSDYVCSLRSAVVLIRDNKILLQKEKNGYEYALPGGHVRVGETSNNALIREYKEETDCEILCNRLLWIDESFWKWKKRDAHTITFYYLISLKNACDIPDDGEFHSQKDNCNMVLKWIPLDQVKSITVYPAFLKEKICKFNSNIEHFIYRE